MAKYFYDTEFLEGTQKKLFGKTVPTIDLISIGIVCEDNREYYAVSKDFNLKEAWNRYDEKNEEVFGDMRNHFPNGITKKIYWIRENVLKPIYEELVLKESKITNSLIIIDGKRFSEYGFTYSNLKRLLKKYGKSNKQIAKEIKNFCYLDKETEEGGGQFVSGSFIPNKYPNIELYGYYSAYDHVALCWLFGKMVDLPTGFPMYTIDLKQELDNKESSLRNDNGVLEIVSEPIFDDGPKLISIYGSIKELLSYPKQTNEHHALADAKWIFELYKFLNKWQ